MRRLAGPTRQQAPGRRGPFCRALVICQVRTSDPDAACNDKRQQLAADTPTYHPRRSVVRCFVGGLPKVLLAIAVVAALTGLVPARAATCASSVGPGIPPPAQLPSGLVGFHAAWYGQSGYMSLCAGTTATATVAFYNSGSRGWVAGRLGEVAYLGTWNPDPGQDRASYLGGDGTNGSPATGWPRFNRLASQPAAYVGANTVTVPVVDRGPQVAGREFDLTYATKLTLGCPDICTLQWIR